MRAKTIIPGLVAAVAIAISGAYLLHQRGPAVPPLAAAIAPKLTAGATADEVAHAVVMHLADDLRAG